MSRSQKILELIDEYVLPHKDGNILALEMAHNYVFGEKPGFDGYADAREEYKNRDWSKSEFEWFVAECKRVVETNQSMIPESYFIIVTPENPTLKTIKSQLDEKPYQPEASGKDRAGFHYTESNRHIDGRYIYVDVDTNVTYSGDVNNPVTESAIEFKILPEKNLLIVESSSVVKVQKAKSIFRKNTGLDITIAGDLTLFDNKEAADRVEMFRKSFAPRDSTDQNEPALVEVHDLQLKNPTSTGSAVEDDDDNDEIKMKLTDIDFEGTDIAEHPKVRSEIEDGWIIKRLSANVRYKQELMNVTIAGNSVLGYTKIENFTSRAKAEELSEDVRNRYLKFIAHANEPGQPAQ